MVIQFSTTDRKQALRFLQTALKSYYITEDNSKSLLDLVGEKIRVGDPQMNGGNAPVYPIDSVNEDEVNEIVSEWMLSLKKKVNVEAESIIPYAPAERHEDDVLNQLLDEDIG